MNENCELVQQGAQVDCFTVIENNPDAPIISCTSCTSKRLLQLEIAVRKLCWLVLTQNSFGPKDAVAVKEILWNHDPKNIIGSFDEHTGAFSFLDELKDGISESLRDAVRGNDLRPGDEPDEDQ